jgi:hypothetical protein
MGNYKTNQIMYWGTSKVTDHNRAPLQVSYEFIERKSRMAKGTLRKYLVAKKRTWSTSWDMLPTFSNEVVDGGMSATAMETFVKNNTGAFTLTLRDGQGNQETAKVMVSDFSNEIQKRGTINDFWSVSVTLEEV